MKSTKDYLDISEFKIDTDLCIKKVKQGVAEFKRLDIPHKIPQNINQICSMRALGFFSLWFDDSGEVFLPDQVDPEKVTEYIEETRAPKISHEMLYALVCKKQQKTINELYNELNNTNGISIHINISVYMRCNFPSKLFKKIEKKYIDLCIQRKKEHPKMIKISNIK